MGFWHKLGVGLKFAEKLAVVAGQQGVNIKGYNPADVDAAAHAAADTMVKALKKKATSAPTLPTPPAA